MNLEVRSWRNKNRESPVWLASEICWGYLQEYGSQHESKAAASAQYTHGWQAVDKAQNLELTAQPTDISTSWRVALPGT